MANKRKINRRSNRKSLKGKWGKVGAPPKKVKFPTRPFTMKQLFARNPGPCELTIRDRVESLINAGTITQLDPRKQPKKGVGRPSDLFVLTEHLNGRTPLVKSTVQVVSTPAPVTPEAVPVTNTETVTATPAPEVTATPAPEPVPEVTQPEVVAAPAPETTPAPVEQPVVA
jgi:hypothetical protein